MNRAIQVAVVSAALGLAMACDGEDDSHGGTGTSTATDCPATTSGGPLDCTSGPESGTSSGSTSGDPTYVPDASTDASAVDAEPIF